MKFSEDIKKEIQTIEWNHRFNIPNRVSERLKQLLPHIIKLEKQNEEMLEMLIEIVKPLYLVAIEENYKEVKCKYVLSDWIRIIEKATDKKWSDIIKC